MGKRWLPPPPSSGGPVERGRTPKDSRPAANRGLGESIHIHGNFRQGPAETRNDRADSARPRAGRPRPECRIAAIVPRGQSPTASAAWGIRNLPRKEGPLHCIGACVDALAERTPLPPPADVRTRSWRLERGSPR